MEDETKDKNMDEISEDNAEVTSKPNHDVEFENDPSVDAAVDKIVNEESDKLLAAEDEARERQFAPPKQKNSLGAKLKSAIAAWWNNRRLRKWTFIGMFIVLLVAVFIPFTRYGMLNAMGVRVSTSMTVVDSQTKLPLKNIPVNLQGQELRTNDDGWVSFSDVKLGNSQLKIDKRGYAVYEKILTLGWGSNPLGDQPLVATGSQFTFVLHDWLSDKPLKDAEATSGEDTAKADEQGKIILTVGDYNDTTEAIVKAAGYRGEKFILSELAEGEQQVKLVPSKKHAFVSNRNGEYDLYKIDADGASEEVLLKASGKEREVPFVLPSQTKDVVAYVTSRSGETNRDGFVLDGLYVIDVITAESYKVARSEQLQVIGWSGNKLVYVAVTEGTSAANSQRSRLVSFDLDTKERTQLATSNYFNDVKLVGKTVYYAVSSYAVPKGEAKLFSIEVDGQAKEKLVNAQVWSIVRKNYDTLLFDGEDNNWYQKKTNQPVEKLKTQPANRNTRYYADSPNGERAVWVDVRDGKGVLIVYNAKEKKEDVLLSMSGLSDPVYWMNDSTVIFRVSKSDETADYVVNVDGGEPKKITNVVGNKSRYFY